MDFENSEIALQKESECEFSLTCTGKLVGKVELYATNFTTEANIFYYTYCTALKKI